MDIKKYYSFRIFIFFVFYLEGSSFSDLAVLFVYVILEDFTMENTIFCNNSVNNFKLTPNS